MTNNEDKKDEKEFEDELNSIREEMRELKEMLKAKAKEEAFEEEIHKRGPEEPEPPNAPSGFKIEFGDDDFNFEGVGSTLGDYLSEVMEGVAQNISNSMKQMTSGFQFEEIKKEVDHAKREFDRNKNQMKHDLNRARRDAKRVAKDATRTGRRVMRFQKLTGEELEKFFETAPDLTGALSDEKKLRLLKALENEPMYQKDLSETTGIKGGTFKHHMDPLLEMQYVAQEAVRGRYFITQLGVEAMKLSEMLFRRYTFITDEDAKTRSESTEEFDGDQAEEFDDEEDQEFDEDLEQETDEEIATTSEAINDIQNEEEDG